MMKLIDEDRTQISPAQCSCFKAPYQSLGSDRELGMDESFAEVSLLFCSKCGQCWLRYFYEMEAFPGSGRWYLGAVTRWQASNMTASAAKYVLEGLSWYFYRGSYYDGRTGKASGEIHLNP